MDRRALVGRAVVVGLLLLSVSAGCGRRAAQGPVPPGNAPTGQWVDEGWEGFEAEEPGDEEEGVDPNAYVT
ncbi:MAG: hypothetical protein ACE5R4_11470, partial [Armatimonadota bacterium]